MSSKKYFENIRAKISFIARYFKVFRLLVVIIYLTYLALLIINVFSALEYVPFPNEVKAKFSPIRAKIDVINSIEGYFSGKQGNLEKNLLKTRERNIFSPYEKDDLVNNLNNIGNIKPEIVN